MGSSSKLVHCMLALACVAAVVMAAEAAITCGTVTSDLASCINYLTGKAASPPTDCCSGVTKLYNTVKGAKADRVTACNCIVSTAKSISGIQSSRIGSLAGSCGITLGYTPSTTTNCASIP